MLFHILFEASNDLSLQIIATTHSLTLLKYADNFKKNSTQLNCLQVRDGIVQCLNDTDFEYIQRDIAQIKSRQKNSPIIRTTVLFEDNVGSLFFQEITRNIFHDYILVYSYENNKNRSFSNSILVTLANSNIPEFKKIIYVVDPDTKISQGQKSCNLALLPGEYAIERIMYKFLSELGDSDRAWNNDLDCTQQECFTNYNHLDFKDSNIKHLKEWTSYCLKNEYLGANNEDAYKLWTNRNKSIAKEFCLNFLDILKNINLSATEDFEKINKLITDKFN
jgi:hypothetical protein